VVALIIIIYYKTRTHSTHKNEESNKNRKLNRTHTCMTNNTVNFGTCEQLQCVKVISNKQ